MLYLGQHHKMVWGTWLCSILCQQGLDNLMYHHGGVTVDHQQVAPAMQHHTAHALLEYEHMCCRRQQC